jgi:hypothetical protein
MIKEKIATDPAKKQLALALAVPCGRRAYADAGNGLARLIRPFRCCRLAKFSFD